MNKILVLFLIIYIIQLVVVHCILMIEHESFIEKTSIPNKKIYFLKIIPFAWIWFLFKKIITSIKDLD